MILSQVGLLRLLPRKHHALTVCCKRCNEIERNVLDLDECMKKKKKEKKKQNFIRLSLSVDPRSLRHSWTFRCELFDPCPSRGRIHAHSISLSRDQATFPNLQEGNLQPAQVWKDPMLQDVAKHRSWERPLEQELPFELCERGVS